MRSQYVLTHIVSLISKVLREHIYLKHSGSAPLRYPAAMTHLIRIILIWILFFVNTFPYFFIFSLHNISENKILTAVLCAILCEKNTPVRAK